MLLNENERQDPDRHISIFKFSTSLTYLGIKIVPQENIALINYDLIMDSTFKSIERWKPLPISLTGRINILKMSILPKFTNGFQHIPLAPPEGMFVRITSLITKCIWNKKCPRVRLSLLYLPFDTGGLKCPIFIGIIWLHS